MCLFVCVCVCACEYASVFVCVCSFLGENNETLLDIMLYCFTIFSFLTLVFSYIFCLFKNLSNFAFFFFLFHILPHGPIKSPVFLFIIMVFLGRVRGYNDMYSCILMAQVKISDNI